MLNGSWPCCALREYVILTLGCKPECWMLCGLDLLPESRWSCQLGTNLHDECLLVLIYTQVVCDPVCWVQTCMLNISWHCFAISMYVILSIWFKPACWMSCWLDPPSDSMWSCQLSGNLHVNFLLTLFFLQYVCGFVNWLQACVINVLRPYSVCSMYVILSIGSKLACWMSVIWISPQTVCDLVNWVHICIVECFMALAYP
jgi:hypothetical protein